MSIAFLQSLIKGPTYTKIYFLSELSPEHFPKCIVFDRPLTVALPSGSSQLRDTRVSSYMTRMHNLLRLSYTKFTPPSVYSTLHQFIHKLVSHLIVNLSVLI